MLRALVHKANRLVQSLAGAWFPQWPAAVPGQEGLPPARPYEPLERVLLTDEVGRTLFDEFAEHRKGSRGDEETGWVLLGLRQVNEAIVLATLPAGAQRDAGVAHVQFNSNAQAMGSRIVRQIDRRLGILGVVHTHPGSLRHPSDGDYEGDSLWVGKLRGGEGIFGIGTADARPSNGLIAEHPKPHVQALGDLCFTWYSLRKGDRRYRPLPVELTLGPDLARPLHSIWPIIEAYADQLDRLYCQQAQVTFDVVQNQGGPALSVNVKLAGPAGAIRIVLGSKEVRYYLVRGDEVLAVDVHETQADRGVYLLLAELAGQC
jgi:hypothetical protein